jgi:F-type H+-transporting ATPase subunit b
MLREAQAEAEKAREQARVQAEEERNRILAEARDDIVALALAAAERLVRDTLDEKQQRAILKRFFAGVPAEAKGLGDRVLVVSAVPLTDDEKAEVAKITGAKEVEYKVDPSILGGMIVRAGDKVVDGSVRGDLSALSLALR